MMKKIKCSVCACEFIPEKNEHYISRDEAKTGLSTIAGGFEEKLYDTFDCPQCGCQIVMQERKRVFYDKNVKEEDDNDDE